jgi:hypothetical protein
VGDGWDGGALSGSGAPLTAYELFDHTQRVAQQLAAAYERLAGDGAERVRAAAAPEFLRCARRLLALRLLSVAGDRRRAFPQRVPPAGDDGVGVAALWSEVFWTARARSTEDESGLLEAADATIRGVLALRPSDLADPDTVRGWWARLEQVERTFGGLEMEAQVTVEGLQVAVEYEQQVRPEAY